MITISVRTWTTKSYFSDASGIYHRQMENSTGISDCATATETWRSSVSAKSDLQKFLSQQFRISGFFIPLLATSQFEFDVSAATHSVWQSLILQVVTCLLKSLIIFSGYGRASIPSSQNVGIRKRGVIPPAPEEIFGSNPLPQQHRAALSFRILERFSSNFYWNLAACIEVSQNFDRRPWNTAIQFILGRRRRQSLIFVHTRSKIVLEKYGVGVWRIYSLPKLFKAGVTSLARKIAIKILLCTGRLFSLDWFTQVITICRLQKENNWIVQKK